MKRSTKVFALILAFLFIFGQLAGCSQKGKVTNEGGAGAASPDPNVPSYLNLTGFPVVKQPVTLKAMGKVSPGRENDYKDTMVWVEYEKMTGIKIDWITVPQASIAEKRNLALASGDLPDFFYRMGITDSDKLKYGEAGTFVDLKNLIDKYGPNLKKIFETNDKIKKSLTSYNGSIYALAVLNDGMFIQINPKNFINKKWLDKIGMKAPTTTDELYTVLKAFKEKDPNGNGKADEIPWSGWAYGNQVINAMKGSFGLGNRGVSNGDIDVDPKTGKLRFLPTAPEFKDLLAYLGKLYQEGLIDQEIFTNTNTKGIAKVQQNIVGMFNGANTSLLGVGPGEDFVATPGALKGPKGDQMYAAVRDQFGDMAAFVLTNTCKYPEAAMRWIDYFYGEEGVRFFFMGIEGKTYYKTPDGKYEFLPEIVGNIPSGSSFDDVVAKYTPYGGGGSPTIVMEAYFKGGETQEPALTSSKNLAKYVPKDIWGPFNYTLDEMERYAALNADIGGYVNQMIPKFITGKEPLSSWESYVEQIKKMGIDEFMKLNETAYERYKK